MKALILAAGFGRRLKPITDRIPKTLIKIRNKPILGHILSNIKKCKIKDVVIVTGYKDELIKDYVGSGEKWGLHISYCHNDKYNVTENIYSVKLASQELQGDDFILINADDLFPHTIISKMMKTHGQIVIAVDGEGTLGSEEMKVRRENGRITSVTKKMDPTVAFGEDIGITKFSREGGQAFFNTINDIIEEKGPNYYFQEAIDQLASNDYPVTYVNVENEPWIEIDDHFDLKWANIPISHMILDRIRAFGKRIKSMKRRKKNHKTK
jgi:choline kinase